MRYVSEAVSAALVDLEMACDATRSAYLAAIEDDARSFPVVLGHGSRADDRFSIKSASCPGLAGVKLGSYWPRNSQLGRPRHNSCILIFNQEVGGVEAAVEARLANAFRTSAGNALATGCLSRPDATRLVVFGAGHQARYECEAVMSVRPIEQIQVVNRDTGRAGRLAGAISRPGVEVKIETAERACETADIIVTITGAHGPLFDSAWVRPGTHISCMGADAAGKQELPVDLLLKAELFCDFGVQSVQIGELQHIAAQIRAAVATPTDIGRVLSGQHPGRSGRDAITIFDSSGLALQDLFLGQALLREAERRNLVGP